MEAGAPLLPENHREPDWTGSSFCAGASGTAAFPGWLAVGVRRPGLFQAGAVDTGNCNPSAFHPASGGRTSPGQRGRLPTFAGGWFPDQSKSDAGAKRRFAPRAAA